jgi:hypothetical protein
MLPGANVRLIVNGPPVLSKLSGCVGKVAAVIPNPSNCVPFSVTAAKLRAIAKSRTGSDTSTCTLVLKMNGMLTGPAFWFVNVPVRSTSAKEFTAEDGGAWAAPLVAAWSEVAVKVAELTASAFPDAVGVGVNETPLPLTNVTPAGSVPSAKSMKESYRATALAGAAHRTRTAKRPLTVAAKRGQDMSGPPDRKGRAAVTVASGSITEQDAKHCNMLGCRPPRNFAGGAPHSKDTRFAG